MRGPRARPVLVRPAPEDGVSQHKAGPDDDDDDDEDEEDDDDDESTD